jgi:hypothetical protein
MSILTNQFNLKTDNSGLLGTIINSPLQVGDKFFVEILTVVDRFLSSFGRGNSR